MMRVFFALALLAWLAVVPADGGGQPPVHEGSRRGAMSTPLEGERVSCEARILDAADAKEVDASHVRLDLRVRFTLKNEAGSTALVIPEAVKVVGVKVAKSEEDARAGRYLIDRRAYPSFKQPGLLAITDPRSKAVRAIPPGEEWEWDAEVSLTLSRQDSTSSFPREAGLETLKQTGAAWWRFELMLWPHTMEEEGARLSESWKDSGSLLRETVTSTPLKLDLTR
jgi:hypothetical protein